MQDASKIDFEKKAILWQGIQFPFIQEETLVLPARTRSTIYVNVANPEVSSGYVPRLRACEGIYLGEAMVTNRNGRAFLQAINSSDRDVEFSIPTVELGEIEQATDTCLGNSMCHPRSVPNAQGAKRLKQQQARTKVEYQGCVFHFS